MKKRKYLFLGMIFSLVLLANFCYATEIRLLCVDNGEEVMFSECNPAISDRTCTSDLGCKYCVSVLYNGAFCPASINECNSAQLSCDSNSYIITNDEDDGEDEEDYDDTDDEDDIIYDDYEDDYGEDEDYTDDEDDYEDEEDDTSDNVIDLTDDSETEEDYEIYDDSEEDYEIYDDSETEEETDSLSQLGASLGTRISVGNVVKKNDKSNTNNDGNNGEDENDVDENGENVENKKILGPLMQKIGGSNTFAWFLLIMTFVEMVVIFFLLNFKKKKEMQELTEKEINEISVF